MDIMLEFSKMTMLKYGNAFNESVIIYFCSIIFKIMMSAFLIPGMSGICK